MDTLLPLVLFGLVLGMRHATDPDHVIAMSTIITRYRSLRLAGLAGAFWGVGHTVTVALVGVFIIFFEVEIPPRLGLAMEFSVALMLILLGVLNLSGVMRWATEKLTPEHEHPEGAVIPAGEGHVHLHVHAHYHSHDTALAGLGGALGRLGWFQALRPLVIGMVHGLAGSAAVALLVLTTIHERSLAFAYLLVFSLGVMAGMAAVTTLMGLPFVTTSRKLESFNRGLVYASGVLSLAFGLWLAYQVGMVDGLFGPNPQWEPA
ncbi:MAG: high-affinity nickel-transport family protein [Chloroflexi bacterium]|nr:high-affinity nickel-transport family protein [Chloroflexota bacterium]